MKGRDTTFTCQEEVHEVKNYKVLLVDRLGSLGEDVGTDLVVQIARDQLCLNFAEFLLELFPDRGEVGDGFDPVFLVVVRERVVVPHEKVENGVTVFVGSCQGQHRLERGELSTLGLLYLLQHCLELLAAEILGDDDRPGLVLLEILLHLQGPVEPLYLYELALYLIGGQGFAEYLEAEEAGVVGQVTVEVEDLADLAVYFVLQDQLGITDQHELDVGKGEDMQHLHLHGVRIQPLVVLYEVLPMLIHYVLMGLARVGLHQFLQEYVHHQYAQVVLEPLFLRVLCYLQQLVLVRIAHLRLDALHVLVVEFHLVEQVVYHVHRVVAEGNVRLAFANEELEAVLVVGLLANPLEEDLVGLEPEHYLLLRGSKLLLSEVLYEVESFGVNALLLGGLVELLDVLGEEFILVLLAEFGEEPGDVLQGDQNSGHFDPHDFLQVLYAQHAVREDLVELLGPS